MVLRWLERRVGSQVTHLENHATHLLAANFGCAIEWIVSLNPGLAVECKSAVSSVVEHHFDTVGVTGSNPVSRTTEKRRAADVSG